MNWFEIKQRFWLPLKRLADMSNKDASQISRASNLERSVPTRIYNLLQHITSIMDNLPAAERNEDEKRVLVQEQKRLAIKLYREITRNEQMLENLRRKLAEAKAKWPVYEDTRLLLTSLENNPPFVFDRLEENVLKGLRLQLLMKQYKMIPELQEHYENEIEIAEKRLSNHRSLLEKMGGIDKYVK